MDNILVVFEIFHLLKKKFRKVAFAAKLAMNKAYDKIERAFLSQTMCDMSLPYARIN